MSGQWEVKANLPVMSLDGREDGNQELNEDKRIIISVEGRYDMVMGRGEDNSLEKTIVAKKEYN